MKVGEDETHAVSVVNLLLVNCHFRNRTGGVASFSQPSASESVPRSFDEVNMTLIGVLSSPSAFKPLYDDYTVLQFVDRPVARVDAVWLSLTSMASTKKMC